MPDIVIPGQGAFGFRTFKSKRDGSEIPVTNFMAEIDGVVYPCQSFGDRRAQLDEAIKSGKPITVESITDDQFQGNHFKKIAFPKGSGGQAQYRQKFGGYGGYRGKPLPFQAWWETTHEAYGEAIGILRGSGAEPNIVAAEARSLVAQYWMACERGLTFPSGYEPTEAAATSTAPPPAAPAPQPAPAKVSPAKAQPATASAQTVEAMESAILEAENEGALDALSAMISRGPFDRAAKLALQRSLGLRRRELVEGDGGEWETVEV